MLFSYFFVLWVQHATATATHYIIITFNITCVLIKKRYVFMIFIQPEFLKFLQFSEQPFNYHCIMQVLQNNEKQLRAPVGKTQACLQPPKQEIFAAAFSLSTLLRKENATTVMILTFA